MHEETDMEEFIKSKGLWEEFESFEMQQKAKRDAAIRNTSVGDLQFGFKGHRSRYCYECSGSNFDESGPFIGLIRGFFELDCVDPSSNSELDVALTKDEMERPSKSSINSVLDEAELNKLFDNLPLGSTQTGCTFHIRLPHTRRGYGPGPMDRRRDG